MTDFHLIDFLENPNLVLYTKSSPYDVWFQD